MKSRKTEKGLFGRYTLLAVCLALALMVFLLYGRTVRYGFSSYDDQSNIVLNTHIQDGFTLEAFLWSFNVGYEGMWQPVTWLSHMLDCRVYGLDAGGHHLTNVLLHALNSALLFLLLFIVTRRLPRYSRIARIWNSAFVAALFAVHPLNVESVAWITERKNVLSTLLMLLALIAYSWYTERPGAKRYLPVLIAFTLGLMSKPMLVTLPFVMLLLDYWPLGRTAPRDWKDPQGKKAALRLVLEKVPLFLLSAATSIVASIAQKSAGGIISTDILPFPDRLAHAAVSYAAYIGKTLWPTRLTVFYPVVSPPAWQVIGAAVLVAGLTLPAFRFARKRPWFTTGWLWYLGTLVPVIGLVKFGAFSRADRFCYVPLIGLFIVITWGAADLSRSWRHRKTALTTAAAAVLLTLMILSWFQVGRWKNSLTLFEHALEVAPSSYTIYKNLAYTHAARGDLEEAVEVLEGVLRGRPDYREALIDISSYLQRQGKNEEAGGYLRRLKPAGIDDHLLLGARFTALGMWDDAASHWRKVLESNPDHMPAKTNLGFCLLQTGDLETAETIFLGVLELDPSNPVAHCWMGMLHGKRQQYDEAEKAFRATIRHDRNHYEAHFFLGSLLCQLERVEEGIPLLEKAAAISPANVEARLNLAMALIMTGRKAAAMEHYKKLEELDPAKAKIVSKALRAF